VFACSFANKATARNRSTTQNLRTKKENIECHDKGKECKEMRKKKKRDKKKDKERGTHTVMTVRGPTTTQNKNKKRKCMQYNTMCDVKKRKI
jgi:hypothetical protein